MLSPVLENIDGKIFATGDFEDHIIVFRTPIFAYYQETVEQMKQDDFIDEYSGIEDINPNTVGTIIIVLGLPDGSLEAYDFIATKFIIIEDYVIVAHQSTFYNLTKLDL